MVHLYAIPLRADASASLPPGPAPLTSRPSAALPPGDTAAAGDTSMATAPAKRPHATYKVSAERVNLAAQLLSRQIPKYQIKRILREKFAIRFRQSERVLRRARDLLLERAARPKADIIGEILEIYQGIIRHPESSTRDRLDATEAIRSMFGLDAPKRAAVGPDGQAAPALVNVNVLGLSDVEKQVLLAASFRLRFGTANAGGALTVGENKTDGDVIEGKLVDSIGA